MPNASPDLDTQLARIDAALQSDQALAKIDAALAASRPQHQVVQKEQQTTDAARALTKVDRALQPDGTLRPAFEPPSTDTRRYLNSYSNGTVDLNRQELSHHTTSDALADSMTAFKAAYPAAFSHAVRAGKTPQLANNLKAVHYLNTAPPTPPEKLASIPAAAADWLQHAPGQGVDISPEFIANIPPAALTDVFSRFIDNPDADPKGLLRDPQQREIYNALGGAEFAKFAKSNLQFYSARSRWGSLLGHPVNIPAPPPGIRQPSGGRLRALLGDEEHTVPVDRFFRPDLLAEVSPSMRDLITVGQVSATNQAEYDAQEAQTRLKNWGAILGPLASHDSRAAYIAEAGDKAGEVIGTIFDLGTLGAAGGIYTAGSDAAAGEYLAVPYEESLLPKYRQMKSNFWRNYVSHQSDTGKSNLDLHTSILANFPGVSDEKRDELQLQLFSGNTAVQDSLKSLSETWAGKGLELFGVKAGLNEWFYIDHPDMQRIVGDNFGAFTDDEGALFAMAVLGAPALRLGVGPRPIPKKGRVPFTAEVGRSGRRDLPRHQLFEFDDGTTGTGRFSQAGVEDRARMLTDIVARVKKEVKDPDSAKALVGRLENHLRSERIPLNPRSEGWMHASIDRALTTLDSVDGAHGRGADLAVTKAINEIAPAVAEIGFDVGFVIRGAQDVIVNPAVSAQATKATREFLEAARGTAPDAPAPRRLAISRSKLTGILGGLAEETARLSDGARRAGRIDEVLGDVKSAATHELQAYRRQHAHWTNQLDTAATEYNNLVGSELARTGGLAENGGILHTPNRAVKTKLYDRATSALTDKSNARLRDLLWSKQGNPNRRIAQRVGGEELARTLQALRDTEVRLVSEAGKGRAQVSDAIRVRREAESLFRSHLERWHRSASAPERTFIQPAADQAAAVSMRRSIKSKLDQAFREGAVADLTPAELSWLNQHRPRGYAIRGRENVRQNVNPIVRQLEGIAKRQGRLQTFLADIDKIRPGLRRKLPTKEVRLQLPAALRTQIRNYLDDSARTIFDGEKRYIPIQAGPSKSELSALGAWDDALRQLTKDERAINAGVLRMTAEEASLLPTALQHDLIREAINNANGLANEFMVNAHATQRWAGRRLTPKDRRQVWDALNSGDPAKLAALPTELYNRLQHLRKTQLREAFRAGLIDADQFKKWSREDYVHYAYLEGDKALRVTRDVEGFLPKRFTPLSTAAKPLNFRVPEDSYWVRWREGRRVRHEKGFADATEASAFLDALPGNVREAAVHAPEPRWQKLTEGLVPEPVFSHLTQTTQLATAINNHRMGVAISKTGLALDRPSIDARVARGAGELSDDASLFTADGFEYIRVDSDKVPSLHGKYVHGRVFKQLHDYATDLVWTKEITDAVTTAAMADPASAGAAVGLMEKIQTRITKIPGYVLRPLTTVFSASKVLVSQTAMRNSALGNILNYQRRSLDSSPVSFARGMTELPHSIGRAIGNHIKVMSGEMPLEADPVLHTMVRKDLIRHYDRRHFHDDIKAWVDRDIKAPEGIRERIHSLQDEWNKVVANEDFSAATQIQHKIDDLEKEFTAASRKSVTSIASTLVGKSRGVLQEAGKFVQGQGKSNQYAWDAYQWLSLDFPMKYHVIRVLHEVGGYSLDEAAANAAAFCQNLHRTGKTTRRMLGDLWSGGLFGGFRVDQLRIFANTAAIRPAGVLKDISLLAGFNTAGLLSSGIDPQEYVEGYAKQHGIDTKGDVSRTLASVQALAHGIFIGSHDEGRAGIDWLELGHIMGFDLFELQNPRTRRKIEEWTEGIPPVAQQLTRSIAAHITSTTAAGLGSQLLGALYTGTDENGDPLKDMGDWAGMTARLGFQPSQLPPAGYHWNRFKRSLQTDVPPAERTGPAEIDPRNLQGRKPWDVTKQALLGIRTTGGADEYLRASLREYLKAHDELPQYNANEAFENLRTTKISRGGGFGDGTLDDKVGRRINEEWYAEHANKYLLPSGETRVSPDDPTAKAQAYKYAKMGTTRAGINRQLRVDHMMGFWAFWKSGAGDGMNYSEDLDKALRTDVARKLINGSFFTEQIQEIGAVAKDIYNDPNVPDDVKGQLNSWVAVARTRHVESLERKLGL